MWSRLTIIDWGAHAGLAYHFSRQLADFEESLIFVEMPRFATGEHALAKLMAYMIWALHSMLFSCVVIFRSSVVVFYTPPEYGSRFVQLWQLTLTRLVVLCGIKTIICVKNISNYERAGIASKLIGKDQPNVTFALETSHLESVFMSKFPACKTMVLPLLCEGESLLTDIESVGVAQSGETKTYDIVIGIPGRMNADHKDIQEILDLLDDMDSQKVCFVMLCPRKKELEARFRAYPNVVLSQKTELSIMEHMRFLSQADFLLLPLNKDRDYFLNKGSGSIYDALVLNKPVIASQHYDGLIDDHADFYYSSISQLMSWVTANRPVHPGDVFKTKRLGLDAQSVIEKIRRA